MINDSQNVTKCVKLQLLVNLGYCFTVNDDDLPLLSHPDTRAILFAQYMRTRLDECRFAVHTVSPHHFIDGETFGTVSVDLKKAIISLDFDDVESLPVRFPMHLQKDLAEAGSFANLFAKRFAPYKKELNAQAPAFLTTYIDGRVHFNIEIDDAASFDKEKLRFVDGWQATDPDSWPFMLIYDGRYIPASDIAVDESREPGEYHILHLIASKDVDQEQEIYYDKSTPIEGTSYYPSDYISPSPLPFINDILDFVSYDK